MYVCVFVFDSVFLIILWKTVKLVIIIDIQRVRLQISISNAISQTEIIIMKIVVSL